MYSDNHKACLNQLVEACYRKGTKFFAQLAYSLDAILAVGYRVKSKRGIEFRRCK